MYCYFWKQYSLSIINIDTKFCKINKVINEVYPQIERDDDDEGDPQQFSILRWSMQLWH